jgi:hypothetical protein
MPPVPGLTRALDLQLRSARFVLRRPVPRRSRLAPPDGRLVFVIGCPRSGTTFLGQALGSLPGFIELGECPPFKGAIPKLAALPRQAAAKRAWRILTAVRALGLVGRLRGVEHTPETSFIAAAVAQAFPQARFVHLVRDGRDVACSLLAEGWFAAGGRLVDETGRTRTDSARFWVEPERADLFERVSEAQRCAWAWRRYVAAARSAASQPFELRYERMASDPAGVAAELAHFLDAPEEPLAEALGRAHGESIGRHERDLSPQQLEEVEAECGELLRELGYAAAPRPG